MRSPVLFAAFCLTMAAATPVFACRAAAPSPNNAPHAELYRNADAALVIATINADWRAGLPTLHVDDTVYGTASRQTYALGSPGDPQYTYIADSGEYREADGSVVVTIGCGHRWSTPNAVGGQRVLASIGITRDGTEVIVRWIPLDAVHNDSRVSAYLAARRPAERQRRGRALRRYYVPPVNIVERAE